MLAELGYLGTAAITGTRKPRGAELSHVQRACNRAINSARDAVERAIAHLQRAGSRSGSGPLHACPDLLLSDSADAGVRLTLCSPSFVAAR